MKQDYLQMRVLELAPQVFVTGQLYEHDVRLAAKQGVRTIMNNRPDGEAPGQPLSADLEKVATELGMTYVNHPFVLSSVTREDIEEYGRVCEGLERPLLIFCRSGARSTRMWEMAEDL